jgi:hypothetical protein
MTEVIPKVANFHMEILNLALLSSSKEATDLDLALTFFSSASSSIFVFASDPVFFRFEAFCDLVFVDAEEEDSFTVVNIRFAMAYKAY